MSVVRGPRSVVRWRGPAVATPTDSGGVPRQSGGGDRPAVRAPGSAGGVRRRRPHGIPRSPHPYGGGGIPFGSYSPSPTVTMAETDPLSSFSIAVHSPLPLFAETMVDGPAVMGLSPGQPSFWSRPRYQDPASAARPFPVEA